ncbi:Type 1 glutamine amidotransferase-like domain-containing protein [Shewanella algae]
MQTLLDKPLMHLSGGDTYRFLRGLYSRNQQQKLKSYTASGHLLVGVSVGSHAADRQHRNRGALW